MMNHGVKKWLSLLLTMCLTLTMVGAACAETADFEALVPLMDVVCAASLYSPNAPETVPGADGELTSTFVDAFFKVASVYGAELGVTKDTLTNAASQEQVLGGFFAASLPELQPVQGSEDEVGGYIGFHPVVVNDAEGDQVQIIGEVYFAEKALRNMSEADYAAIEWKDRAVFTFRKSETAAYGYELTGFSVGTDLSLEKAMQAYFDQICVEYESSLGFTLLYPSVFGDELIKEDDSGMSAELDDGSVKFFAKRFDNENGASLADYIGIIANGINGSVANVNEEMQYGTIAYTTAEGYAVFDVIVVTEDAIYQAELSYLTSLMEEYSMYNAYLENSFVIDELSQG